MTRRASALLLILLLVVAGALAIWLTRGGHQQSTPPPPGTTNASHPFVPDPNAASWDKPFKAGDPQAPKYGEAFQILDTSHRPAHATSIYWLGSSYHGLYPYVRAMLGHGAEVMLSTVVYGSKLSVDLSRISISAYSTKPLPTPDPDTGSNRSEGGILFAELTQAKDKQTTNGLIWASVTTKALAPGTQAIVEVNPHLVIQIVRLDSREPALAQLVAALKPYPQR